MYQPKLVRYVIFYKTVPTELNRKAKIKLQQSMSKLLEDVAILEDQDSIVVECIKDLGPDRAAGKSTGDQGVWVELDAQAIKSAIDSAESMDHRVFKIFSQYISTIEFVKSFSVIVAGGQNGYWFQTHIDMDNIRAMAQSTERTFDNISGQPKIFQLNQDLTGQRFLHGNRISSTKLDIKVFALGGTTNWEPEHVYTRFLIALHADWGSNARDGFMGKAAYDQTVRTVLSKYSQLLVSFSLVLRTYKKPFRELSARIDEVRELAHQLQTHINGVMHIGEKGARADRSRKSPLTRKDLARELDVVEEALEETLITRASMYFAQSNELEQEVLRMIKDVSVHAKKLESSYSLLVLEDIKESDELLEPIPSLRDESHRFAQTVHETLLRLRDDVHSAQSNLSNAIEVLKTYLESRQRITQERSERAITRLTIIFLCFGMADAISNFVIYYLEDSSVERARMAFMWFWVIVVVLLGVAVAANVWIYRKK